MLLINKKTIPHNDHTIFVENIVSCKLSNIEPRYYIINLDKLPCARNGELLKSIVHAISWQVNIKKDQLQCFIVKSDKVFLNASEHKEGYYFIKFYANYKPKDK